jgi:hypothetical protein
VARPRFLAFLVSAVLAAAISAGPAAAPGVFSVGVLRRDGVLIPFGTFNGREWSVAWPGADLREPLPIGLADVPKRWWGAVGPEVPWRAWLREGVQQPLKLLKPVHVPIFCGGHLAVATDYVGEPAPEREPTVSKDGIATAGDVTVLPITQVSVNAPDAARLIAHITDRFNDEEALAENNFTNWNHPYSQGRRREFPITLEAFYRAVDPGPDGDFRTNYIEAVRRFPAGPMDQGCGLITFVRGWVTEYRDKKPEVNIGARITYCDRADISFMQPFGRVSVERSGGRGRSSGADVYWIYQTSSWRDEFYSIARVAPEGVRPVLVVAGGGCPKDRAR